MKKSRIASPVPHPESSLRHLPLVDLLVDTKTDLRSAPSVRSRSPTGGAGHTPSLIRPMG